MTMQSRCVQTITFVLVGAMFLYASMGQALSQVTSNVILRALMLRAGPAVGTSFTIDVDGRQYLITAKHVVATLKQDDTIYIMKDNSWSSVTVKVLRCDDPVDIAVLIPSSQLTINFPLEATMDGMQFGQEVYFLGFPYGFHTDSVVGGHYPVAFIKRATMSATVKENGATKILLDGYNNVGFSGGPIVFRDFKQSGYVLKVAAVVSGFEAEMGKVFKPQEIKPDQITQEDRAQERIWEPDGHHYRLNDTETVVKLNTGIIYGYSIQHAVDLIRKNPSGPNVSDQFKQ